jgi:hypothetical protein
MHGGDGPGRFDGHEPPIDQVGYRDGMTGGDAAAFDLGYELGGALSAWRSVPVKLREIKSHKGS